MEKPRVLFLTANYFQGRKQQDPFRESLLRSFCNHCDDILYLQVNDFIDEQTGSFFSPFSRHGIHKAIKKFEPNFVFSINGSGLNSSLYKFVSHIPTAVWFIDTPWRCQFSLTNELVKKDNLYVYAAGKPSVDWLNRNIELKNKPQLTFFCSEPINEPFIPFSDRKYDVSFVGSLWRTSNFGKILRELEASKNQILQSVQLLQMHSVEYQWNLYEKWLNIFPDTKFNKGFVYSIFDDHISSTNRLSAIHALSDFKVSLHGSNEWWEHIGLGDWSPHQAFDPQIINSSKILTDLIRNTRIALNISHHQASIGGCPIRIFDSINNGSVLLTNTLVEEESGFKEGRDFYYYSDIDELKKLSKEILKNPPHPEQLEASRGVILDKHTFNIRTQSFLQNFSTNSTSGNIKLLTRSKLSFNFKEKNPILSSFENIDNHNESSKLGLLLNTAYAISRKSNNGQGRRAALKIFLKELGY